MVSEKKISKKSSRTLEADKYSANNAQPFLLCTEGVPALAAGCQIVLEAACWWMPRNLKTWGFEIHEELSSPIASLFHPPRHPSSAPVAISWRLFASRYLRDGSELGCEMRQRGVFCNCATLQQCRSSFSSKMPFREAKSDKVRFL
jgi:hypothetical protein